MRSARAEAPLTPTLPPANHRGEPDEPPPVTTLANGLGGFTDDGRTYAIVLDGATQTPMPWVNVIANPRFGTVVTASGAAHTWAGNSRENRLTAFANDPVSDPTAEALFVRDDDTGERWTPRPGPSTPPTPGRSVVRHFAGGTTFSRATHGILHTLEVFVDADDPVKYSRLTMSNRRRRPRTLSVFAYAEWALGPPRDGEQVHVVTDVDAENGALCATNAYSQDFAGHVAFAFASEPPLARHRGSPVVHRSQRRRCRAPAALDHAVLSGAVGAALDPCAALQVRVRPAARRTAAAAVPVGTGRDRVHARAADRPPRAPSTARRGARRGSRAALGRRRSTPCRCARPTTPSTR